MPRDVIVFTADEVAEGLSLLAKSKGVDLPPGTFQQFSLRRGDYDPHAWFVPKDTPGAERL